MANASICKLEETLLLPHLLKSGNYGNLVNYVVCCVLNINGHCSSVCVVVKPFTAKMKIIVNKSNEARVPKLLVDFLLQDAATQLSRQQYLSIIDLTESFKRMNINR